MPFDQNDDPFANINFSSPISEVNNDAVSEVLKSFNPQEGIADIAFMRGKVEGGTDAGISRVNANVDKTGVIGFKDKKGQASFTNVAVDSTGQTSQILPNSSQIPVNNSAVGTPNVIKQTETALPVAAMLDKLRNATDIGSARAIYDSLTQAATAELTKLETETLAFAQNKIGIPLLEKNLNQARETDTQSIGYYPGIGDSPVSQKAQIELNSARTIAGQEAKRLLETNFAYNSLNNVVKQAGVHFQRLEATAARRDTFQINAEFAADQHRIAKDEDEERRAESITPEQLSRINLLRPADMQLDGDINPKVRANKILSASKDKNFQAAVNAQGMDLPILALQGNAYATALVMAKEEAATGLPQTQVKAELDKVKSLLASPTFIPSILARDKKKGQEMTALKAAALADPNKKTNVDNYKLQLAMNFIQQQKTEDFYNKVDSWGSIDPILHAAMDKSMKISGNRNFENVLTAYVGDAVGMDAIAKYSAFRQLMETAQRKHKDSLFGSPDLNRGNAMIVQMVSGKNYFGKWLDKISKIVPGSLGLTSGIPVLNTINKGREALSASPLNFASNLAGSPAKVDDVPLDPATGRPFGE